MNSKISYAVISAILATQLAACGGSGNVSPVAPPKGVQVSKADEDYLKSVGRFAADFYGVDPAIYNLFYDDINRTTYPLAYAGIPEGWYILGLSWENFAVVHSGLVTDKWQVAETASHEICHVVQRHWGYELSWYDSTGLMIPYAERWYEAQCKYMGMYLAMEYFQAKGVEPKPDYPDDYGYWYAQTLKYPQPPLPTGETSGDVGGKQAFDIIWGRTPTGG